MAAYGTNPYPRSYGGGKRYHIAELEAQLDRLAPGWDTDEDTELYAEVYAHAVAVAFIWAMNGRLRNQTIPMRMIESLPDYEEACSLRPVPGESLIARRRRVATKLRGLIGNTIRDIIDTCSTLLGQAFDEVVLIPDASTINYWPGVNPGPPGFEFSTTRATFGVRMKLDNITASEFLELRQELYRALDSMCPAWLRFQIGTGASFIVNQGVVGQTFI